MRRQFFEKNALLLGFAAIALFVLPVIFLYPFNVDVDRWQWIADTLVRFGGLPYLAAWDHDFPGVIIVHLTAIYLFGNSMLAFRTVEYAIILVTVFALYKASRLWLTRNEALFGCLIFSLFYAYGRWDCMGQRDNFAVLPIVLGVICFVRSTRTLSHRGANWSVFWGGVMVGIATCIRPTYALLLAVPFVSLYRLTNLHIALFAISGFLVPVVLMILPFAYAPHGLDQAYVSAISYNTDVYSHFPPTAARFAAYLRSLLELRALFVFLLSAAWLGMYIGSRTRKIWCVVPIPNERRFLVLYLLGLLIGTFVQQSLSAIHFTPFYACFIPILGKTFLDLTRPMKRLRTATVAFALLTIGGLLYPWGLAKLFLQNGFSVRASYGYFPGAVPALQEDSALSSYLLRNTNPSDVIEIIGDPALAWRTPRRLAGRFPDPWVFIFPRPSGTLTGYQTKWKDDFLESLSASSPKYIVSEHVLGDSAIAIMPQLKSFVHEHYDLTMHLGLHTVYVRK